MQSHDRLTFPATTLRAAALLVSLAVGSSPAQAQDEIAGWGFAYFDSSWSSESFVEADAAGFATVARRADGTVAAWGNDGGKLVRVPAVPPGTSIVEIAGGSGYCLARLSDGTGIGWPATNPGAPGYVPSSWTGIVEFAAGHGHSLARFANGTLAAWGGNAHGQTDVPHLPAGLQYTRIAAGVSHSLALRSDGAVIGWGRNDLGQCNAPPAPAGLAYVELSAGYYHSVGRLSDGSVVAWGGIQGSVPVLPAGLAYVQIASGLNHALARRSDGAVVAWGSNFYGQCDVPALPAGTTYTDISASRYSTSGDMGHSVALRSDGKVIAFGWNGYTQLGVPAPPAGESYVQVDTGCGAPDGGGYIPLAQTLALRSDGQLVTWGDQNSAAVQVPPPSAPPGVSYVAISAGGEHNLALRSDGAIAQWGSNWWGQLNGMPALPAGTTYVAIAAGIVHNLALRSDGQAVGWGFNSTGPATVPPLPAGLTYVEVDTLLFSLGRRSDGSVIAWGNNSYGQHNVPPLPAGLTYVEVAAGFHHGLARRSDGSVVGWGSNLWGQIDVPVLPPGVTFVEIAAGPYFSAARCSDGTLRSWGGLSGEFHLQPRLLPGERFTSIAAGVEQVVATVETVWTSYCTAKTNSLGCVPSIAASGAPSAGQSSGFVVRASQVRNRVAGLLLYTTGGARAAIPYQCGTLCLGPSGIRRTPGSSSGGNPLPANDCSGVYAIDMNAFAAGAAGGNPSPALAQPGTIVHAQWWGRDNGFVPPCATTLSDAIEYAVRP